MNGWSICKTHQNWGKNRGIKSGWFLHPKLRCMYYLSDVNYPTDNLSQMDNLSLVWIQPLWWRHVMHLNKEDNPLPACRQINQYNYFQPYLWTDKQRGKTLWNADSVYGKCYEWNGIQWIYWDPWNRVETWWASTSNLRSVGPVG